MSSAILYAAIVAIWAGVLVPRWLRQRSVVPLPVEPAQAPQDVPVADEPDAAPERVAERDETAVGAKIPAGPSAEPGLPDPRRLERDATSAASPAAVAAGMARAASVRADGAAPIGASRAVPVRTSQALPVSAGRAVPVSAGRAAPAPAGQRASTLRARRRMLATLVLLTPVAAALSVLHLVPGWAAVPPALMLAGFLVVLRDAAHTDAGRSFQRAPVTLGQAHPAVGVDEHPAPAAPPPVRSGDAPETGAQVIDISGRLGDQLYDQYADPPERAVGD